MKNATFPSLRVEPELREAAEKCLREGETISSFVEQSIRDSVERRRLHDEFMARGLVSRDEAGRDQTCVSANDVVARLEAMLAEKKARK